MMRIILLISIFTFFYACANEKVDYLPQVVYLKAPELNKDNNLLIEFAVSDIEARTGNVKIILNDKEYELKNRYFSSTGTIITKNIDYIPSGKFSLKFEITTENDKTITEFKELEVNKNEISDKFNVENIFLSKKNDILEKTSNAILRFTNSKEPLFANEEGKILLENIEKNKYDFDIEGRKKDNDGFYRYIFLESIVLNKETKLYFNIVFDENEYYDEPLLSCNYSSSNNKSFAVILFFLFLIILKIYNKKFKSQK